MYETYLQNEREFEEKFRLCNCCDEEPTIQSHNRLSRIKEMKALEKELDVKKEINAEVSEYYSGYNAGLQLSLDKIREFISKLEQV